MNQTNIYYSISNITIDYLITDICVNPIDLFVIWSETGSENNNNKGYIYKTRYDGSNKTSIINQDNLLSISLAIDYTIKRIYWIDHSLSEIVSIDYDGNERKFIQLSDKSFVSTEKMDLYNGFIYWSESGSSIIYKINTNGEELSHFEPHENFSRAFKIIHPSRQPNVKNLCADTDCSHLCLPIDFHTYRCLCPDIKAYNLTKNCEEYV